MRPRTPARQTARSSTCRCGKTLWEDFQRLQDNLGTLFAGKESNYIFTPSFGIGYYDDGDGKKLGNNIEFRTTFELSYQLENQNRIGLSFGHISNANLGDKNPGVEILSLSYQVPFN